jgi:hypothetical protein
MDRKIQMMHLAVAERHVAEGERHILEQEQRVADLDWKGRETLLARRQLQNFRDLQAQHVGHRDHILRKLRQ